MGKKKQRKRVKTRDYSMMKLINGATKSGIHKDHKKESNKFAAREKVEGEEDECWQCGFSLQDECYELYFCSKSCYDYFHDGVEDNDDI